MWLQLSLAALAAFQCLSRISGADLPRSPIVSTSRGQVRGLVRESENATRVYFYQGIRYGHARRFERPKETEAWLGVYDATKVRYVCPQPLYPLANGSEPFPELGNARFSSEDCLFLNIWTPGVAFDAKKKLPVMFYIHGGSHISGTIFLDVYDGLHLSALGDVVVVTINYRLGAFGFAATDENDQEAGNFGLWDTKLALEWTVANIGNFGGDAKMITIFGESAGAGSVSALLLSPTTKGMFKRAMIQSGSPIMINPKSKVIAVTNQLATSLGCPATKIFDCLRKKTAQEVLNGKFSPSPVFGEQFIPKSPKSLLANLSLDVDIVTGVTQDEGVIFVEAFFPAAFTQTYAQVILQITLFATLVEAKNSTKVVERYAGHLNANSTKAEIHTALGQLIADAMLKCPLAIFGEVAARANPSQKHYAYMVGQAIDMPLLRVTKDMGVCHGADVYFLFGVPITKQASYTEADRRLSHEMIARWTTFAKTGEIGKVDEDKLEWTEAYKTTGVQDLMDLADGRYQMAAYNFAKECAVWEGALYKD